MTMGVRQRVVIVGARADGQAKVVLEILEAMRNREVVGFLDDDPARGGSVIRGVHVLGAVSDLPRLKRELSIEGGIVAIADNRRRRELGQALRSHGLELITAIHPTAHVDSDVTLGEGDVICPGVILVTGTRVGDSVNLHTGCTIDHDSVLADGVNVAPGVHTGGRVRLETDAFVGIGASLLPDVTVGAGAVVGAGCVVLHDVPAGEVVVGVPGRVIRGEEGTK